MGDLFFQKAIIHASQRRFSPFTSAEYQVNHFLTLACSLCTDVDLVATCISWLVFDRTMPNSSTNSAGRHSARKQSWYMFGRLGYCNPVPVLVVANFSRTLRNERTGCPTIIKWDPRQAIPPWVGPPVRPNHNSYWLNATVQTVGTSSGACPGMKGLKAQNCSDELGTGGRVNSDSARP